MTDAFILSGILIILWTLLEVYEYYPLNQLSQKNKLVQINKQKDYSTKTKSAKKDKTKPSKIGEEDIYEYNPSNINEYNKPSYSPKDGKKELHHKRGSSHLTGDEYKIKELEDLLIKHRNITDELENLLLRDQSERKSDTMQKKTPSSLQKDEIISTDNEYRYSSNKYQIPSPAEERKGSTRAKSIQNNKYGVLISSPMQKGDSMAYFKLQFLTTKEVCEKFWSQIDSGELSASMFEFNRNSGKSSKTNFLSPEKNRGSRITLSNDTEYTGNNSPAGKNKYGKAMNYPVVNTFLKNKI